MRLFVSAKPCPYQSIPTKVAILLSALQMNMLSVMQALDSLKSLQVITVRPYMTFTNRLGQDMYIKLSSEDEPKVLCTSDSRVSFVHCENGGMDKLQVSELRKTFYPCFLH